MDQPELLDRFAARVEIAVRDMLEAGSYVDVRHDWSVVSDVTVMIVNVGARPGTPGAYSMGFEVRDLEKAISADVESQLRNAVELLATKTASVRLRAA